MKICGFQKMTMLDYPEKVACTIFTGGCNFRCPFCHNALLVTELDRAGEESPEAILSYLQKRKGLLDGVCITGGEPLLHPDIGDFMEKIKAQGFLLKLDTNGSFPARLKNLVAAGLVDYVAMDIKNRAEKYGLTIGVPDFDLTPIGESVDFLLSGAVDFEFRTTVIKEYHTVEDIARIADRIAGAPRYFLQNFKESDNMIGADLHAHEKEVLEEMKRVAAAKIPTVGIRGI